MKFFAKKISPESDGPHHWRKRVKYRCGCGQIEGVISDLPHKAKLTDRLDREVEVDKVLTASGEEEDLKLREIFKIIGHKNHICTTRPRKGE